MTLAYRTNAPEPCVACGNKDEPQVTYNLHRHFNDGPVRRVETHTQSGCRACCPRYITFPTHWRFLDQRGRVVRTQDTTLSIPLDWTKILAVKPGMPIPKRKAPGWLRRACTWVRSALGGRNPPSQA